MAPGPRAPATRHGAAPNGRGQGRRVEPRRGSTAGRRETRLPHGQRGGGRARRAGGAIAACGGYRATGAGIWGAIAHVGAYINLFSLLPVWQLDGGRGFRALTRPQRWIAVLVVGLAWLLTGEGLLLLLVVAGAAAAWFGDAAPEPDRTALLQYTWLVGLLSLMTRITVPGATPR